MVRKLDGAEIKNAVRSRRIDITEADIKKGKPLQPDACAAAQCILRSLGVEAAKVHRGMTYIKEGKSWRRFKTSAALRLETIIFDRGGTFIPGEYDLLPVPLHTITPPKKKSAPSKGRTRQQVKLATRRHVIPNVRASARVGREEETEE